MKRRNLKLVEPAPKPEPLPSLAYEHEQRQRIAATDWAALHIRGDRSAPIEVAHGRRGGAWS